MNRALVFPLVLLLQLALWLFRVFIPEDLQDEGEEALAMYYHRPLDLAPRIYRAARKLDQDRQDDLYRYVKIMVNEPHDEQDEIFELRQMLVDEG